MANSASGNLNSSTQISENCKFNGPPRYTRNWGTTKMFVNTKPVTFSFLCQIGSNKSNEGHSSHKALNIEGNVKQRVKYLFLYFYNTAVTCNE